MSILSCKVRVQNIEYFQGRLKKKRIETLYLQLICYDWEVGPFVLPVLTGVSSIFVCFVTEI